MFLFLVVQVKLKDSLVSSLSFVQTREAELAWVDGRLVIERSKLNFKDEDKMETDQDYRRDVVPILEQLPPEEVGSLILLTILLISLWL